MAGQRHTDETIHERGNRGTLLRRRGILATAGAIVAGIVAKQASRPVAAVDTFAIPGSYAATIFQASVWSISNNSFQSSAHGITGLASSASQTAGVLGYNFNGTGVYGATENAGTPASGLFGVSGAADSGIGVLGKSTTGKGVQGQIPSTSGGANTIAVYGVNQATGANSTGVYGAALTGNGVVGVTYGTGLVAGLYGTSPTAYGIIGNTTAPFYSGLTATTNTPNCAALAATSTNPAAFAAYFSGFTYVQGNFAVSGNKSAAVMHPDGTRRLLYCVESPEAWFEDFGEGKLVNGNADVRLDPDFAALVATDTYHVFPVSHDPASKGLSVSARHKDGFTVQEHSGGVSSGTFSWRVVARRKDAPGKRLEKLTVPKFNVPDPDKLPKPVSPKQP